jgi:ABC-2 type transport system permease protein
MNWRRTLSIMRKEWWHITRDRTSFFLLMLSPVLALVTMGYAFSVDIKNVRIGALDQDRSALSRAYLSELDSTQALRLEAWPDSLDDVENLMIRGRVRAVVIIPPGLERDLLRGRQAELQIIVDGTDPNTAGHAIRHISAHTESFVAQQVHQQLARAGLSTSIASPIDLSLRAWYNPSLRYTVSMIPALVGVVLSVPAMAASLALAREREWGTLEGLIATPIGRIELIVGKLVPYMLAGMLSVPLCIATAIYGYHVSFAGNLSVYLGLAALFLFATMSISLFISIFAPSQQVAIIASMLVFLLSGFFMSGLLIPFTLMGPLIKLEAFMFPTTHFVIISRGLFVKGVGVAELQAYILALAGLGILFLALTVLMFKKKLA